MRVHTCDDCDPGSMLTGEDGVFMTGVVTTGVCDGEARQVGEVSRQRSETTPAYEEGYT